MTPPVLGQTEPTIGVGARSRDLDPQGARLCHATRCTHELVRRCSGTYRTPSLASGTAYLITALVAGGPNAVAGSSVARLVTIKSSADPTRKDAVKLVVKTLAM